jgi:hypothetical protein
VLVRGFPAFFAARMAQRVRYPDGAVERALRALAAAPEQAVRDAAGVALRALAAPPSA